MRAGEVGERLRRGDARDVDVAGRAPEKRRARCPVAGGAGFGAVVRPEDATRARGVVVSSVVVRVGGAGVVVRKAHIVLTIKSDRPIKSPRVFKSEQTSAKRFHHEIKLTAIDDLDAELKRWLKAAYDLSD